MRQTSMLRTSTNTALSLSRSMIRGVRFSPPRKIEDRISDNIRARLFIPSIALASFTMGMGCSGGAVPGLDGGDWFDTASSDLEDGSDTSMPTTLNESGQEGTGTSTLEDPTESDSNDEISPSSTSIDPDDSEISEEDSGDSASTSTSTSASTSTSTSTTDSDVGEDSGSSASESSDSGSSSSTTDSDPDVGESSTSSSDSGSTSDSSDSASTSSSSTNDTGEEESTDSTTGSELDCDSFIEQEYRAINATYVGWFPTASSVPEEQTVLQPFGQNGTVDFTIQIPCRDNWYVWIRGYDELMNDSFGVKIDGAPSPRAEFEVDCRDSGNQYRWTRLHRKNLNDPPCQRVEDPWVQQWDPGNHHLIVYPLSSPALSRIIVSNNPDFVP